MKGCMGQRFYNAVVWIAERVRVKKVGNYLKLVQILYFSSVDQILQNSLT